MSAHPIRGIPALHFTPKAGSTVKASGAVCECGERTFTISLVERPRDISLWASCTSCEFTYRITEYQR